MVQAEAARIPPHVDMNPILLKPTSDVGSQVVVLGRAVANRTAKEYHGQKAELLTGLVYLAIPMFRFNFLQAHQPSRMVRGDGKLVAHAGLQVIVSF